eukprot:CAMPEP_0198154452 /NCGR_PEP_ID=MMETSP1443-20131203/68600_1 /TAXON_ID=186043 /ORGANISM="Entomoneis sp., Strain CCMP2396" /LENGTH=176 /DNA_ID=CAMNT_0043821123 /DNA_START=46 /DNA_END=576 /DNA_ORIENTATION=-
MRVTKFKHHFITLLLALIVVKHFTPAWSFAGPARGLVRQQLTVSASFSRTITSTTLNAQISEKEAQSAMNKVVAALRKDSQANEELGRLDKVTVVLGYGAPSPGTHAVRFNASFKKGGFGLSSVPLPFGLGQTSQKEGRGTMVGQVKASVDAKNGKISSCSVFRDLGYGRSFNLKV